MCLGTCNGAAAAVTTACSSGEESAGTALLLFRGPEARVCTVPSLEEYKRWSILGILEVNNFEEALIWQDFQRWQRAPLNMICQKVGSL